MAGMGGKAREYGGCRDFEREFIDGTKWGFGGISDRYMATLSNLYGMFKKRLRGAYRHVRRK